MGGTRYGVSRLSFLVCLQMADQTLHPRMCLIHNQWGQPNAGVWGVLQEGTQGIPEEYLRQWIGHLTARYPLRQFVAGTSVRFKVPKSTVNSQKSKVNSSCRSSSKLKVHQRSHNTLFKISQFHTTLGLITYLLNIFGLTWKTVNAKTPIFLA